MKYQNNHFGNKFGHQFDHDVVRTHNYSPSNSPLDQKRTRTNYELTLLMKEYVQTTEEEFGISDQVTWETYRVMSDFLNFLSHS